MVIHFLSQEVKLSLDQHKNGYISHINRFHSAMHVPKLDHY